MNKNLSIGYMRVSTEDQKIDLQRDALEKAGCSKIYEDRGISGSVVKRPGLDQALDQLRSGDTLVVWRLDRLGRNLRHLLETVDLVKQKGAAFKSLSEGMDTSTPTGQMIFSIFASIAEFERNLIRERVNAGLTSAKKRGAKLGPPVKITKSKKKMINDLRNSGTAVAEIARQFGISRRHVYRVFEDGTT